VCFSPLFQIENCQPQILFLAYTSSANSVGATSQRTTLRGTCRLTRESNRTCACVAQPSDGRTPSTGTNIRRANCWWTKRLKCFVKSNQIHDTCTGFSLTHKFWHVFSANDPQNELILRHTGRTKCLSKWINDVRGMIQNNVDFSHKNDTFHHSIIKL